MHPSLALSPVSPASPGTHATTGLLIREALQPRLQHLLYAQLCSQVVGSREWETLLNAEARARPWPLCVWNHPYTGRSNARSKPAGLYSWAEDLARRSAMQLRHEDCQLFKLCAQLDSVHFDSLVSLLYDQQGSLRPHVDDGLPGLGLSLSLGASCHFDYGGTRLTLQSGDALFGAFGHVAHEVVCMGPSSSAPAWWRTLPEKPSTAERVGTFGKVRCNLQLRHGRDEDARNERRRFAKRAGRSLMR